MTFTFHVQEVLPQALRLQFNCTEFKILHKDEMGEWTSPPIWATMGRAVIHRPFSAVVGYNGTILSVDAKNVHQAVVQEMHEIGALPVELTTALEVIQPASLKGVYDSLGSQWNVAGLPTISSPVVLANPITACPNKKQGAMPRDWLTNAEAVAGSIVLIERGVCTFIEKIQLLHELQAVGVIVVDTEDEPLLLMGGSTDQKLIPSVMVTMEVGKKLKSVLSAGEVLAVKMLTGVEAMEKKGSVGELGGDSSKKAALPDFLGYNSMIEDQIKRRFGMFPMSPVGIGDSWSRNVKTHLEGQKLPTWVNENYQLVSIPAGPPCERSRWSSTEDCTAPREGSIEIFMNTTAVQKPKSLDSGPEPPGPLDDPMSPDDIKIVESGILYMDAASGLLLSGSASQSMVGKARYAQVYVNGEMQDGAYMETRMNAKTDWTTTTHGLLNYQPPEIGMATR